MSVGALEHTAEFERVGQHAGSGVMEATDHHRRAEPRARRDSLGAFGRFIEGHAPSPCVADAGGKGFRSAGQGLLDKEQPGDVVALFVSGEQLLQFGRP